MLSKTKTKYIHGLSRKKVRDALGLFLAEGPKVVDELLRAPNTAATEIFATAQWLADCEPVLSQFIGSRATVTEIDDVDLKHISALATPNQVLAIFSKPAFPEPPRFAGQISLLLDTIQDPGNLGTIIRCADWFGIENIICSPTCADVFNLKVIQSTMGSIARVRVITQNLGLFIEQQQEQADTDNKPIIPILAAALDGDSLHDTRPVSEGFLLIGNEARGISEELLARSSHHITIPRKGEAESLNAAVATGIILSHLVKHK